MVSQPSLWELIIPPLAVLLLISLSWLSHRYDTRTCLPTLGHCSCPLCDCEDRLSHYSDFPGLYFGLGTGEERFRFVWVLGLRPWHLEMEGVQLTEMNWQKIYGKGPFSVRYLPDLICMKKTHYLIIILCLYPTMKHKNNLYLVNILLHLLPKIPNCN